MSIRPLLDSSACTGSNYPNPTDSAGAMSIEEKAAVVFEDICSENLKLISMYKSLLEQKDFESAFITAVKIKDPAVRDIAFKRIALSLAEGKYIADAVLTALNIIDSGYRTAANKDIFSAAEVLKINIESALKKVMDLYIELDKKILALQLAENISCYISNKNKRNIFLMNCLKEMVSRGKYAFAMSILNCIAIREERLSTVETQTENGKRVSVVKTIIEPRREVFNIIFNKLLGQNHYELALDLAKKFKEIPPGCRDMEADEKYNYSLITPLIYKIIDLLLLNNDFETVLIALRSLGSMDKSLQINNVLDRLFQKSWNWKVTNYRIILTFCDEAKIPENRERNIEYLNFRLSHFCKTLIKSKHFVEAEDVISHISSASIREILEKKLADASIAD